MRALIQRVSKASVSVDGKIVGAINKGLVVLVGIRHDDSDEQAEYIVNKTANLRIFDDSDGKMNLSALDIGGELLVISQFTLYGDTRRGRRPGFSDAARPDISEPLYEKVLHMYRDTGLKVEKGIFGTNMQVEIHNDGPVTLMIDSDDKQR